MHKRNCKTGINLLAILGICFLSGITTPAFAWGENNSSANVSVPSYAEESTGGAWSAISAFTAKETVIKGAESSHGGFASFIAPKIVETTYYGLDTILTKTNTDSTSGFYVGNSSNQAKFTYEIANNVKDCINTNFWKVSSPLVSDLNTRLTISHSKRSDQSDTQINFDNNGTVTEISNACYSSWDKSVNDSLSINYADKTGAENSSVYVTMKNIVDGLFLAPEITIKNPYGGPDAFLDVKGLRLSDGSGEYYDLTVNTNDLQFGANYIPALSPGNTDSITFNADGSLDIGYTVRYDQYGKKVSESQVQQSVYIPSDLKKIEKI